MEFSAANEIEKQRIEADMRTQISHIEATERCEAEFVLERAKERNLWPRRCTFDCNSKELAEERQQVLRLEYEAKTRCLELELREKAPKLPTIKESDSGVTARSVIQERLRDNVEAYTSKVLGSVASRGTYAENIPSVQLPIAQTQVISRCYLLFLHLHPASLVANGWDGTRSGWGNPVTSLKQIQQSNLQGLETVTHIIPLVPASLVAPPKLGFTPGFEL